MSAYREKRTVVEDVPVGSLPVVETRYDSVVSERRGMSGVALAALVVAAITATVVITMLIINSQQRNSEQDLAQERARTAAAAQQTPGQPQPVIVNMPASQPATVAVPYPVPVLAQPAPIDARTAPSSASVEIEVTSLLQNDEQLRSYAIFVKVTTGGTAVLSGNVPDEELRKRAEKVARTVKGVQSIINDIAVRS